MQITLELFRVNIRRSRDLVNLFRAMGNQTTAALDLSDILRAALVMSVSALDHFVHEIVRLGMLEAYQGCRARTGAFLQFPVTIESVIGLPSNFEFEDRLDSHIRARHGYRTFQLPGQIADAVRLISDVELWNELSGLTGMERRDLTDTLILIVQRRNKIAHEADIMPDYAGQLVNSDSRSPIDENTVNQAVDTIERIAEGIYGLVSLTDSAASTG